MASQVIPDNAPIPTLTKSITQDSINQFESCGILERQNIHNDPELAAQRLGTTYPIASGRMSITFAAEALRKFFGPEVFNHTGSVNLKFLRPVKGGDTLRLRRGHRPAAGRAGNAGNGAGAVPEPERRHHRRRARHGNSLVARAGAAFYRGDGRRDAAGYLSAPLSFSPVTGHCPSRPVALH